MNYAFERAHAPHVDGGVVTAPAAQTIGAILIPIGIMALRHHHRVDITTGIIIAAALVLIPWMILPVRTPAARRNSHQVHAAGYVRHCPLVRRTCRPTTRANAGRQPAPAWAVVAVWILPAFTVVLTTLA